jgi:hypothetical protein
MIYLALLIAGALLCNALPHLISGLRGETFYTPWAKPRGIGRSSAVENFLWGAANLLVAAAILDRTLGGNVPHGMVAVTLGFVGAGFGLSYGFGQRQGG